MAITHSSIVNLFWNRWSVTDLCKVYKLKRQYVEDVLREEMQSRQAQLKEAHDGK